MELPPVLGVEGGGTKTEWVLVSPAGKTILRQGTLPPANLKLIPDQSLEDMLALLPGDVARVGVFLAGCATESDRKRLFNISCKVWPRAEITVGSDRESAFATSFGNGDGIAVISGTGSAVTGRKNGKIEKAGGWGQLLGDRGGGYNIAVHGLRHALSCYDLDRRITPLAGEILRALGLHRFEDLVNWAVDADKMSVAKLAPVVFEAAVAGDVEMREAIRSGAHVLADYTRAVAGRLDLARPDVKLLGGLFLNHEIYVDDFKQHLLEILPEASISVCRESGALGAAWLAETQASTAPA